MLSVLNRAISEYLWAQSEGKEISNIEFGFEQQTFHLFKIYSKLSAYNQATLHNNLK